MRLHTDLTGLLTRLVIAALLLFAGCGGSLQLMPTPNIYARGFAEPFPDVPPSLQNNTAQVLFLTDRLPEPDSTPENRVYGTKRSRSVAFGVATVEFGKHVSWSDLAAASKTGNRAVSLPMTITKTQEIGRFPASPQSLIESAPEESIPLSAGTQPTTARIERDEAAHTAEALLSQHLAAVPDKEVFVFVHGYNNSFYDGVTTIAGLWHFLGRRGVPVSYSWPAGRGGLLRGYTYDRESSEFTVFHLKTMIREIAQNPDVKKINLIAHSRGTDVLASAIRELHLEISSTGKSTREELKLGTMVLAAPDIDLDVMLQRIVTARIGRIPERFAMYVCPNDQALGLSNWLFRGAVRAGKLRSDMFTADELHALRTLKTVQIIDARISKAGAFGHDYFHSSPAVSSDLIMLMRYHLQPGAESGRPLGSDRQGFWIIDDDYPKSASIQ